MDNNVQQDNQNFDSPPRGQIIRNRPDENPPLMRREDDRPAVDGQDVEMQEPPRQRQRRGLFAAQGNIQDGFPVMNLREALENAPQDVVPRNPNNGARVQGGVDAVTPDREAIRQNRENNQNRYQGADFLERDAINNARRIAQQGQVGLVTPRRDDVSIRSWQERQEDREQGSAGPARVGEHAEAALNRRNDNGMER